MRVVINPDKNFVHEMKAALKSNNGFCPCAMVKNKDTKCMCKDFREMKSGTCTCGLYTKVED